MARGDKLTSKQRLFCIEYVKCHNATEAAKNAGYSENCAQQIGSENLSKSLIIEKIKKLEQNTQRDLRDYFMEEAEEAYQDLLKIRNMLNDEKIKDNSKLLNIRKDIDKELLYLAGYKPTDKIVITDEKKLEEFF